MTTAFSYQYRQQVIETAPALVYDLLVVGGGITGVGIALDAASRGLKTILVEKNDFAYGTSSRSTKLIHGGLRYLKQLEFGLVKEVGSERAIVHNLAPHLVIPEKMLLPLSDKKGLGYWLTSIGLKVYDWLAGVKSEDQRRMLTRNQTLKYEPLLRPADVRGGAIYAEYRTDDARLTIEIAKAAHAHGAALLTYCRVTDFVLKDERVAGVEVVDVLTGNSFALRATVVVNAAGPWVDTLRKKNSSLHGKRLHLTKGVHIVVPYHRLPVKQAIYFDVDDGRMIFAIPRGRITYIGTTDTDYKDSQDEVTTSYEDVAYLLRAVNATFPSANLQVADVESSWAGLRPLIHEDGKSASELSRKDEIFESDTGLISIAGGKLTGYRKMAERVVSLVIGKYEWSKKLKACFTQSIKLPGALMDVAACKNFRQMIVQKTKLDEPTVRYLIENYGSQTQVILHMRQPHSDPRWQVLLAELTFCIHHEMVLSLEDFLMRRTGLLFFNIHLAKIYLEPLLLEMQTALGWSAQRTQTERLLMQKRIDEASVFKKHESSFIA